MPWQGVAMQKQLRPACLALPSGAMRHAPFRSAVPQHHRASTTSAPVCNGAARTQHNNLGAAVPGPSLAVLIAASTALLSAGPAHASDAEAIANAALAEAVLRPALTLGTLLCIGRIPLTWYPNIDGTQFPWSLFYYPTEFFLSGTRKVIPPLNGVDISPIVWVGIFSFLSEVLIGPQGILRLIQNETGAGL